MEWDLLKPVLVLGIVQAGMYGLLPVALVLSYRVSRTIPFVHGGLAISAALCYWILVDDGPFGTGNRPELPPLVGLSIVVTGGAILGGAFGVLVMSRRLVGQSRMTLTVVSLAAMMLTIGIFSKVLLVPPEVVPPGPFGTGSHEVAGVVITDLKLVTLLTAAGLVIVLGVLLNRTRTGLAIRAIADDLEASVWCGAKMARIGTGVYAASGAIAALAGALIAAAVGPDPAGMLVLFLRGLAIAVVGGLTSLPIALAGAVIYAVLETGLTVGLFGEVDLARRELVINAALLLAILLVAKTRRDIFRPLERTTL